MKRRRFSKTAEDESVIHSAQGSRVAVAQVFAASEGLDYTISIIPGMGHGLQAECGDTDRKGLQVPGYSAEYLDVVRRWLRQRVRPRAQV